MKMGVFAGVETGPVSQGRFPAFLPQVSRWRSVDVLRHRKGRLRSLVLAQCSSKWSLTLPYHYLVRVADAPLYWLVFLESRKTQT